MMSVSMGRDSCSRWRGGASLLPATRRRVLLLDLVVDALWDHLRGLFEFVKPALDGRELSFARRYVCQVGEHPFYRPDNVFIFCPGGPVPFRPRGVVGPRLEDGQPRRQEAHCPREDAQPEIGLLLERGKDR